MEISEIVGAFKTLEKLGVPLAPIQIEALRDEILREIGLSKEQMLHLFDTTKIERSEISDQKECAQRQLLIAELQEMKELMEKHGGKIGEASKAMGHDRQWISDTVKRVLQENPWLREMQSLYSLIKAVEGNAAEKLKRAR